MYLALPRNSSAINIVCYVRNAKITSLYDNSTFKSIANKPNRLLNKNPLIRWEKHVITPHNNNTTNVWVRSLHYKSSLPGGRGDLPHRVRARRHG